MVITEKELLMLYQQLLLSDDHKQALGKKKNLTVAGHPAQVHQSLYRSLSWWARATGLDPDQLLQVAEASLSAVLACCSTLAVDDADACASFSKVRRSGPRVVRTFLLVVDSVLCLPFSARVHN